MSEHAEGTIEMQSWDEQPLVTIDDDRKITTTTVAQRFSGDIEGEGSATWLSVYFADGTAEYTGFQRIEGTRRRPRGLRRPAHVRRLRRHGAHAAAGRRWRAPGPAASSRSAAPAGATPPRTRPRRTRSTTTSRERRAEHRREPAGRARTTARRSHRRRRDRRRGPLVVGRGGAHVGRALLRHAAVDRVAAACARPLARGHGAARRLDGARGLVSRRQGDDRRARRIELTDEGRRVEGRDHAARAGVLDDTLAVLDLDERRTFAVLGRQGAHRTREQPRSARPRCAGSAPPRRAARRSGSRAR